MEQTETYNHTANKSWASPRMAHQPFLLLATITIVLSDLVYSTSINYGIHQQPITDINQLMPKLCQNQTMICEGSFCIPGVKKCVCDLRNPVQFGRYCLRQVDIGVQCFVTSQCNHTVKRAVCADASVPDKILDDKASKFKLDQWQQLQDLRQQTNQATTQRPQIPNQNQQGSNADQPQSISPQYTSERDMTISNLRNSPYEIGYMDPYKQLYMMNNQTTQNNLPRQSKNQEDNRPIATGADDSSLNKNENANNNNKLPTTASNNGSGPTQTETSTLEPLKTSTKLTEVSDRDREKFLEAAKDSNYVTVKQQDSIDSTTIRSTISDNELSTSSYSQSPQQTNQLSQSGPKKIRAGKWPPGKCSCPLGYTFDQMVRKCLPLSLADARCKSDDDCRHILRTHCSNATNKCQCDETLTWNQQAMSCIKEKEIMEVKSHEGDVTWNGTQQAPKIINNFTTTIIILSLCIIFGTLSILILTVKCFSTKTSTTLITTSEREKRKRRANKQKPKQKPTPNLKSLVNDTRPSSQLSDITKATRGRILNYDFETDNPNPVSPANGAAPNSRPVRQSTSSSGSDSTVKSLNDLDCETSAGSGLNKSDENDARSTMLPPSPLPNQPHYMMTSALKGASAPSAIAAAAAAAARKRKERQSGLHNDPTITGGRAHDPVFL